MATFRMCQCRDDGKVFNVKNEDVRALKDGLGYIKRILSSAWLKNSEHYELKPSQKFSVCGVPHR